MNLNQKLEYLSNVSNNKNIAPIIIELSGTPNSGKTSIIEEINTIFRRYRIKSQTICESAKKCKIIDKKTLEFNVWTALETIQRILAVIDQGYKIIFCDRGIFDALTWMKFYVNNNQISDESYKMITDFLLFDKWKQYLHCVVVITCDVETAIKRDIDYNEIYRYGTIVNPDTISKINEAIEQTKEQYQNMFNELISFDTSNNIEKVKKEIRNSVFDYLVMYMKESKC